MSAAARKIEPETEASPSPTAEARCDGCHKAPGKYMSLEGSKLLCLRCLSDAEGLAIKAECVDGGDNVSTSKMARQHGKILGRHDSVFYIGEADPAHPDYAGAGWVYEHANNDDIPQKRGRGWELVRPINAKDMSLMRKPREDYEAVIAEYDQLAARRVRDARKDGRSHLERQAKSYGIPITVKDEFSATGFGAVS